MVNTRGLTIPPTIGAALNIVFVIAAAILVTVFLRSGGPAMMHMMKNGGHPAAGHAHHGEPHHGG